MSGLERLEEWASQSVDAYSPSTTPTESIVRRGRGRRAARRSGILAAIAVVGVAAQFAVTHLMAGGTSRVTVVASRETSAVTGTTNGRVSAYELPHHAIGTFDKGIEARVVESGRCPDLPGLSTQTFIAGTRAATMGILVRTTIRAGTQAYREFNARALRYSGPRTSTKPARVVTQPSGDMTIDEATPRPSSATQQRDLHPSGLPCYFEHWDRSSASTDADLNVLWGDAALYWIVRMRSRNAVVSQVGGDADGTLHMRMNAEEGYVLALGERSHPMFLAVTSAPGTLPRLSALRTALLPSTAEGR